MGVVMRDRGSRSGAVLTSVMADADQDRPTKPTEEPGTTTVGGWTGRLPDESLTPRCHGIQQGLWRTSVAHWPACPPQHDRRVRARYPTVPNWLASNHQGIDVREAGKNLMSLEARDYIRDRLRVLERIDGKAEPDRLWRNLLSSQPFAFSSAGHLHRHRTQAAKLMTALTPGLRSRRWQGSTRGPARGPTTSSMGSKPNGFRRDRSTPTICPGV